MNERRVLADRGDAGERIDLVLRRHLSGAATRTGVQRWIVDGRVRVNGATVDRVARRVAAGDQISVALPAPSPARVTMRAEETTLDIVHEDEHLLIVNKPAGVVVHPTYRHSEGTVMNGLLWRARDWPRDQRPSIVGRLDKLTSGLVVVAKSKRAHALLQRELSSARSEKIYLAVVQARVRRAQGSIELPLGRDPHDRRRVVVAPHGSPSETRFVRLGVAPIDGGMVSLLQCRLMTGRMHQIRVHLASQGWPIVGDQVYGPAPAATPFGRQALHAWRLRLAHPVERSRLDVTAPLPDDLDTLLETTGLNRCLPGEAS